MLKVDDERISNKYNCLDSSLSLYILVLILLLELSHSCSLHLVKERSSGYIVVF